MISIYATLQGTHIHALIHIDLIYEEQVHAHSVRSRLHDRARLHDDVGI
jgi:hypothetical protein